MDSCSTNKDVKVYIMYESIYFNIEGVYMSTHKQSSVDSYIIISENVEKRNKKMMKISKKKKKKKEKLKK